MKLASQRQLKMLGADEHRLKPELIGAPICRVAAVAVRIEAGCGDEQSQLQPCLGLRR